MYPFKEVIIDLITHLPHVSAAYDSVCIIVDQFVEVCIFCPMC